MHRYDDYSEERCDICGKKSHNESGARLKLARAADVGFRIYSSLSNGPAPSGKLLVFRTWMPAS